MTRHYKIFGSSIHFYSDTQLNPFLIQHTYPNGEQWKDIDDAKSWADVYLAFLENSNNPHPPLSSDGDLEYDFSKKMFLKKLRLDAESFGEDVPEELANKILELEAELD